MKNNWLHERDEREQDIGRRALIVLYLIKRVPRFAAVVRRGQRAP